MASLKLARSAQAVPKKYPFPLHFRAAADKKVAQLRSIEVARNPWIQFEVHFTSGLKVSLLQVFEQKIPLARSPPWPAVDRAIKTDRESCDPIKAVSQIRQRVERLDHPNNAWESEQLY